MIAWRTLAETHSLTTTVPMIARSTTAAWDQTAIRYEITEPEIDAGPGHCRMSQRFSGGPVLALASFPKEALSRPGRVLAARLR